MSKKILFVTLETFAAPGGIQKMSRTMAYALHWLCGKNNWSINLYTLNDQQSDLMPQYLPPANFKAFNKSRIKFVLGSVKSGMRADTVILSHVHLSLIGCMIRLFNPNCEIWLIAHGVEVWRPLKLWKKAIWKVCDKIVCVSRFTKKRVIELHHVDPDKCIVLNNALDPFITLPESFSKPQYLLERYKLKPDSKVILTLTRIASSEKFKGYEKIIKAVSTVRKSLQGVKYILAGPYDEPEKMRIEQLITEYDLDGNFILTGYIEEQELEDHFLLADLFVLPSKKEGFGIVFIEAMIFGLPVICGNADGSIDAVRDETMGTAIDPDDVKALERVIIQKLNHALTVNERSYIQHQCLKYFNIQDYMRALEKLIR